MHGHRSANSIEGAVETFWGQFIPKIECGDVNVWFTDEITLAHIERYHRFDADWVSFEDDTVTTPPTVDMPL